MTRPRKRNGRHYAQRPHALPFRRATFSPMRTDDDDDIDGGRVAASLLVLVVVAVCAFGLAWCVLTR